jgi:hypothetical protein
LKPEWWGSPLLQEKYWEEKACDERHPYLTIINYLLCTGTRATRPLTEKAQGHRNIH